MTFPINRFSELTALVVGDVMIDAYLWGNVERQSPEAPVPVLLKSGKDSRIGGAGNVARNVLANKTKFEKMLDVPTNHFVDEKSLKERQEQWKSIAESDDYSDLGSFRNQEGLHFPDLNPQKEDNTYHTNQTWGYHPQDINAPFNIRDLNNLLNTIKNTDTFQAQIRLNRTEQELLDFNHLRTKLVYMLI